MNSIYDELRAALHAIWHRRWIALAIAWAVCLLGWLVVAMVPNSYESRARIFVQLDDPLSDQLDIGRGDRQRDIERVRQTLTSAVNLEKVVRGTRIGESIKTPKQMEAVVLELARLIKVESKQDNLFEITASSNDGAWSDAENAQMAQQIVQKMIDIFREENLRGGGEMNTTLEFMDQQLATRQRELEAAEQRRLEFDQRNPGLAGGAASVSQRQESARNQLRDVEADLAAAQSALAAINGQLAGTPQTIAGAPSQVGGARGALAQAQADLASMRARGLTDNHPDVIAQKNQVAALRGAAASEGGGGGSGVPNPAYTSLQSIKAEREANVQALQARRAALQADLASFGALAAGGPQANAEASRITRDYDVLKKQYDDLLADREQLRLRGQVETEHNAVRFEVIDPPTTPIAPVAPNRPVLLALVLILGSGTGMGAAFLLAQLRSTFSSAGKLERATGLPVLGSITTTITDAGRMLRAKRLKQFYGASTALLGVFVLLLAVEFIQRGMVA